jgi:hypothetical protein
MRSENLIVCALYFMGYYQVLNIYQRLLGPWQGINPIGHYHCAAFSDDLVVSDKL